MWEMQPLSTGRREREKDMGAPGDLRVHHDDSLFTTVDDDGQTVDDGEQIPDHGGQTLDRAAHKAAHAAETDGESSANADTVTTVTKAAFDQGPRRQLRRVGTKIGSKVLPFERPVFRFGPLHVYRDAEGRFRLRWLSRRNRAVVRRRSRF